MSIMGIFTVALADGEKRLVPKDMVRQLRSEAVSWLAESSSSSRPRLSSEMFSSEARF